MREILQTRRLIALAVAYVIALQALLLPLSVAAGSPFANSLCAAAASIERSQAPGSHDSGCPCAGGCGMQCCAQTLAAPPPAAIALELTLATVLPPPPAISPVVRPAVRSPQVARAPPII
ncbi:MAG: hypothetical protein ACREB8_05495 [Pseudolabrys sp.]